MRGGVRLGAGAKRKLSAWERVAVGMQCERAFKAAADDKLQAAKDLKIARSDYRAVIAKLEARPVHSRSAFLQGDAFEQHLADIEEERHAIAETDANGTEAAPRVFTIPPQKPTGVRKNIIVTVADEWSQRIGQRISESTVTRCWEEARAIIRDLEKNEENEPNI